MHAREAPIVSRDERFEVEILARRADLERHAPSLVTRQQQNAVAQHPVRERGGGIVQEKDIDRYGHFALELLDESRVPDGSFCRTQVVRRQDRYVNIAERPRVASSRGSKQVRALDLRYPFQRGRESSPYLFS